jgi:hypothetical protein
MFMIIAAEWTTLSGQLSVGIADIILSLSLMALSSFFSAVYFH